MPLTIPVNTERHSEQDLTSHNFCFFMRIGSLYRAPWGLETMAAFLFGWHKVLTVGSGWMAYQAAGTDDLFVPTGPTTNWQVLV
jgi:hypothetical protein